MYTTHSCHDGRGFPRKFGIPVNAGTVSM